MTRRWIHGAVPTAILCALLPALARAQDESAKELEKRGIEQLQTKQYDEAYATLKRAVDLPGADRETRYQLALACYHTGRNNDAFDILDELDATQHGDMRIPGLYIMLLERRIEEAMRNPGEGEKTFVRCTGDIRDYLARIVQNRPDDFESLAKLIDTCLKIGDIESCLRWGEYAKSRFPAKPDGYLALGFVSFQRFSEAQQREEPEEAAKHLEEARKIYLEGTQKAADASSPWERLAVCLEWQAVQDEAKKAESAKAYGEALARDPASVEITTAMQRFSGEQMVEMLETGVKGFEDRHGKEKRTDDALMRYYYGWYLEWTAKRHEEAFKQLQIAVEKNPQYTDCYYHMGVAALWGMKDSIKAAEAFGKLGEVSPEYFARIVKKNQGNVENFISNLRSVFSVLLNTRGNSRLLPGVTACIVGLEPTNIDYWNNYALACRDEGMYEKSLQAYEKALAIRPNHPQLLNDHAVILHYYLNKRPRALEIARSEYEKAIKLAREQLKDKNLDPDERNIIQIALRDATENLDLVKRGITRQRR